MSYIRRTALGLTEEEGVELVAGQRLTHNRLEEIIERQRAEARARKIALAVGAAGALFAMVRLGWIVFPTIKARRARRRLGELGEGGG